MVDHWLVGIFPTILQAHAQLWSTTFRRYHSNSKSPYHHTIYPLVSQACSDQLQTQNLHGPRREPGYKLTLVSNHCREEHSRVPGYLVAYNKLAGFYHEETLFQIQFPT